MADIRIFMQGSSVELADMSQEYRAGLMEQFRQKYIAELKKEVAAKPDQYAWSDKGDEEVVRVADKMLTAMYHGTASLSNPIKRTARSFGLKDTMTYIFAFVRKCKAPAR